MAIFVDCEEKVSLWSEAYPCDILSVGEGQSVRFIAATAGSVQSSQRSMGEEDCRILYEVEDCDSVSYRREEVCAIWVKQEVTTTVDRPKEV